MEAGNLGSEALGRLPRRRVWRVALRAVLVGGDHCSPKQRLSFRAASVLNSRILTPENIFREQLFFLKNSSGEKCSNEEEREEGGHKDVL